jgi:phosphoglycolate phosphatase-like HAD superfamily hydrolase
VWLKPSDRPVLACDWNGTLVDDAERTLRATVHVLEQRGLPSPDLSAFLDTFRLPLSAFFSACGVAESELIQAEIDWNLALREDGPPRATSGAVSMLDALERLGMPVGVVSAAATDVVTRDMAALGFDSRFSFVIGAVVSKQETLSEIRAAAGGPVAYLGDTEHDMREANAAGVHSIGFAGGYRPASALRRAGARSIVYSLERVPRIVRRLVERQSFPRRTNQ